MSGDNGSWRDTASQHIAEGRPAEALALYREHYLAARGVPASAGARLSVWLSEWADLGRTYPPALDALREQRWAAVERLRGAGDTPGSSRGLDALDDFAEIAAISSRLDEPDYPVDLFADLDARNPEIAEDCAAQARRLLVRAERFGLARRYLGDPVVVVARVAAVFEQRLTRGFAHAPEGMRETLRERTVEDYLSAVREILAILHGVGEQTLAERARQQAVDAVPWAHVREDIAAALAAPAEPG